MGECSGQGLTFYKHHHFHFWLSQNPAECSDGEEGKAPNSHLLYTPSAFYSFNPAGEDDSKSSVLGSQIPPKAPLCDSSPCTPHAPAAPVRTHSIFPRESQQDSCSHSAGGGAAAQPEPFHAPSHPPTAVREQSIPRRRAPTFLQLPGPPRHPQH